MRAIAFAGVLWIAALALLTPWAWFVRGPVAHLASNAGVRVAFDALGLGWGSVTLRDVRFGFEGTTGIEGTAKIARITWKPARIDAEDVHLELSACPLDSVLELARWARSHARVAEVAMSIMNLDVSGLDVPPGDLLGSTTGGAFVTRRVPNRDPLVVSWTRGSDGIDVVVGPRDAPRFRAELAFSSGRTTLTSAGISLNDLAADAWLEPQSRTVMVGGRVVLEPSANNLAPVVAHGEGRVEGFSLPPPYELRGMSFGNAATFRTDIELTRAAKRQLTFRHGHLVFGDIRFSGGSSSGAKGLRLHGEIPCETIADAARSTAGDPVFTAILNRPGADRRTHGWLPVEVWLDNVPWPRWHGRVGSDCGIAPIARLDPALQETLLARPDGAGAQSGMCWALPAGRDYPGFTLSNNVCSHPNDARAAADAVSTAPAELTPKEIRGHVGDVVSFDAAVRRSSQVSCFGPAQVAPADNPLRAGEHRRIEAVVEPWRPAPDGGLVFGDIQRTLPIVPLDYEQIAPVWIEQDREEATGAEGLTSFEEAGEIVVRYQPRDAVDLSIEMRAMLVRSNGATLLYASASLQPPGDEHRREPGTPTFRLSFPKEVARPIRVLVVEHLERACAFHALEAVVL